MLKYENDLWCTTTCGTGKCPESQCDCGPDMTYVPDDDMLQQWKPRAVGNNKHSKDTKEGKHAKEGKPWQKEKHGPKWIAKHEKEEAEHGKGEDSEDAEAKRAKHEKHLKHLHHVQHAHHAQHARHAQRALDQMRADATSREQARDTRLAVDTRQTQTPGLHVGSAASLMADRRVSHRE